MPVLARHYKRFIGKPQGLILLQHLLGGLEVVTATHRLVPAIILDLRHVDDGIPGRAHHQTGNGREVVMQLAHNLAQDGGVAHASVEHPQGRWHRLQVREFHPYPFCNHLFLTAGGDKQQVFLTVVKEPKGPCCRITVHGISPVYGFTVGTLL
jgi:hypothetical protein